MKAMLFGYGRMGKCVAHALNLLGYEIYIIDESYSVSLQSQYKASTLSIAPDNQNLLYNIVCEFRPNAIISTIPNDKIVQDVATQYGQPAISLDQFGLAPGLCNILAERGYELLTNLGLKVDTIEMYCGGLPCSPIGLLGWVPTWSTEGVYNQYTLPTTLLHKGKIKTTQPLTDLEYLSVSGMELEAFNTYGGISNTAKEMQDRGVKNCFYKTLRYRGHRRKIQYFIDTKISKEAFQKLLSLPDYDKTSHMDRDCVVFRVKVKSENVSWNFSQYVQGDAVWTAMQKCTAFPAAVVAHMSSNNGLPKELKYQHLSFNAFATCLSKLCKQAEIKDLTRPFV